MKSIQPGSYAAERTEVEVHEGDVLLAVRILDGQWMNAIGSEFDEVMGWLKNGLRANGCTIRFRTAEAAMRLIRDKTSTGRKHSMLASASRNDAGKKVIEVDSSSGLNCPNVLASLTGQDRLGGELSGAQSPISPASATEVLCCSCTSSN